MQSSRSVESQTYLLPDGIKLYTFKPFVHEILKTENIVPNARSGHRMDCDDDNLYVFGGFNPEVETPETLVRATHGGNLFREVLKFNFSTKIWKRLDIADIPAICLVSCIFMVYGKVMMAYGGTGVPYESKRNNLLFICNLAEQNPKFRQVLTTGTYPPALYGQAGFIKDNYLYTHGGTTAYEFVSDMHRLNLSTNVWEEVYVCKGLKNEPVGRYRHHVAVHGSKVYVLGGVAHNEGLKLDEIPVFDLDKKEWEMIRAIRDDIYGYPPPGKFASAVNIPGTKRYLVIGGCLSDDKVLDEVWMLDISSLSWKKIPSLSLKVPVFFQSTTVTPSGRMITFGGVSIMNGSQKRVFTIQSSWVCIPKLKDISWEAVIHYDLIKALTTLHYKQLQLPKEYYSKLL